MRGRLVFAIVGLWATLGFLASTPLRAATCDAFCECGNDESCGYNAGCCCQQGLIGGGLNYICSSKKCGIRFTNPFSTPEEPPAAVENPKAQHGVPAESPREEWAYLEYTVGSDLAVTRAKAHHASSPVFAETIAQEMVDGRGHPAPGPGTYRFFHLDQGKVVSASTTNYIAG